MSLAVDLAEVFAIGVGTPLSAACVIPLYPAFVAYLANNESNEESFRSRPIVLGGFVLAGVISFMGLLGFVFTNLLQTSLSRVIEAVSPIAYGLLVILGLVLLADLDLFACVPTVDPPQFEYPSATAFSYGFFFGAIIIPCNPGLIALFFARAPVLFETQFQSLLGFLAFGLGIGAPLLAIAAVSESSGQRLTRLLARYKSPINRVTGLILLAVSLYYLVTVFEVLG
jgi:cytochrome c-type biogenesis protein